MKFYCRENELSKMNARYDGGRFECVVIYGRRRIGKTALINKFCEDKRCIQFSALNSTAKENLTALSRAIYSFDHPDANSFPEYATFDEAFAEISRLGRKERIIFSIDEYPYLAKSDSSISSKLQHLIDNAWQDSGIYLILCGSSMSFMQNQVLGYESPLYGRRTAQFRIEPLTYKETAAFNPNLTPEENALIYGITGGVPHYINKLNVRDSVRNGLIENFFEASSYLFEEPENLLKQELREPQIYNSIISAIAGGSSKLNEIATKTGLETSTASKYLGVLIDLGIVKKETPIFEKTGKRSIYLLEDALFRFWYRFVPRHISLIAANRFTPHFNALVGNFLHDYMGLTFEKMCKEYILYYDREGPFPIAEIGQWWGTDPNNKSKVQIDIVARGIADNNQHPDKYIIGSCKFKNEKAGLEELVHLKQYAGAFGKGSGYYYYIFALSGFTEELMKAAEGENVRLVSLEEMYLGV